MNRWMIVLTIFLVVLCVCPAAGKQTAALIKPGDIFPELALAAPQSPHDQGYLGLKTSDTFTLKQVQAEVVLVEIISVYCPACQRQTPSLNNLFKKINEDATLKQKVKLIGIAAGNNPVEIENFKETFNILFPIVPDPQFTLHSAIGGSRTPFTIIVRQGEGEAAGVVGYTHLGALENQGRLLASIQSVMQMNTTAVQRQETAPQQISAAISPLYTEAKLLAVVTNAFKSFAPNAQAIKEIQLPEDRHVYTCLAAQQGKTRRLFAKVIARPPVCSDCHDIHFIYIFDSTGVLLDIADLQLTKWGNEPWDADDLAKMRERVVGKSLHSPFSFNPEVDAVSSATITSAMIFNSLSQGHHLLKALHANGWQ